MKKTLHLSILFLLLMSNSFAQKNYTFEDSVRQAVNRQLEEYPLSTLKDLYKSFFQDAYGPGHLIKDAESAKSYLLRELNSYTETKGVAAEPTGYKHNFLRINLSVLKENIIDLDLFFEAFLESAQNTKPIDIEEWKKEWQEIEKTIKLMDLNLENFETDSKKISEQLKSGAYIGHHSDIYIKTYDPHYRIISSEVYFKRLHILIESEKE